MAQEDAGVIASTSFEEAKLLENCTSSKAVSSDPNTAIKFSCRTNLAVEAAATSVIRDSELLPKQRFPVEAPVSTQRWKGFSTGLKSGWKKVQNLLAQRPSGTRFIASKIQEECTESIAMSSDSHTAMKSHSEVEAATILEPGLSSSPYFSARIQSLSERRSNFADKVEFEIESSKSHWTELSKKENESKELWSDNEEVMESNQVVFERLKEHPEWGPFFRRSWYDLEIGEKIGEGGQAEIFAASGTNLRDGTKRDLVVKAFKDGYFLGDLQRWWPSGLAKAALPNRYFTGRKFNEFFGLCWALDVQLLKGDKFAFVFDRHWGDLRKLIDMRMLVTNGTPPFSFRTTLYILYQIAVGMENMHKFGLLHRDLKAANVLVVNKAISDYASVLVADFESSAGTIGTGFWRAPEILLALRNRSISEPETFTHQTDVYSYAMTCYEVITGCVPFEDRSPRDIDGVLRGERPALPDDTSPILVDLVGKCWHEDPLQRPSFRAIAETLLSLWSSAVNKTMAKMFIDEFRAPTSDEERKWHPPKSAISESDPTPLSERGVIKFLRERPHWRGKLEHEIWSSESHWTELTKESSCDIEDRQQQAHLEIHERLKKHSEWSDYYHNKDLRIGKKIGGGGEADVFESSESEAEFAVKVFKNGYPVQSLLQVRPPGRPRHYKYHETSWRISFTLGTVLLKDKKLAFFFQRHWGDLRKFLDQRILEIGKITSASPRSITTP
jgi:serine/threonine protein kinase